MSQSQPDRAEPAAKADEPPEAEAGRGRIRFVRNEREGPEPVPDDASSPTDSAPASDLPTEHGRGVDASQQAAQQAPPPAGDDRPRRKQRDPDADPATPNKGRKPGRPGGKARAKAGDHAAPAKPDPILFKPMAGAARFRARHALVVFSFLAMVALPMVLAAWYLWSRAADQFASHVAFSVRTEEAGASIELLGAISGLSGSSSSDTDILYEFLQSQELVRRIDTELDLRTIWSRVDPADDPIFAYAAPGTIEDLVDYWPRMVRIHYDSGSGLIDLRVQAFDPEEARAIAMQVFAESSAMINELSAIAREDAIRYARDELQAAEERLTEARVALTAFRNRTQIVDPTMDTQGQMGLVTNLQAQLAEALIELDILRETTRDTDPRITQAERRIAVIENRIEAERANIGAIGGEGGAFADLVGEFERLVVDQEFAEQAYTAALAAFDAARNEARRQSRYLAAHVTPTLAESPQYPQRGTLLGLIGLFAFLIWSVTVLVAYSLRDRR